MSRPETTPWSADRHDQFAIESPDIGDVTVLLPEPKERTQLSDGRNHLVFVRPNGRMVGLNAPVDVDVEDCVLLEDEEGFQHAIADSDDSGAVLLTRRPPGEPDDWELREDFEMNAVLEVDD